MASPGGLLGGEERLENVILPPCAVPQSTAKGAVGHPPATRRDRSPPAPARAGSPPDRAGNAELGAAQDPRRAGRRAGALHRSLRLRARRLPHAGPGRRDPRHRAEAERIRLNEQLTRTLSEVKERGGLLSIRGYCKKIRDDQNYWRSVESYVAAHSHAKFRATASARSVSGRSCSPG